MRVIIWLLGAALLGGVPASAGAERDAETSDLRCLVSYMTVVADQASSERHDAKISASFFVGRIMNRNPAIDLTGALDRVLATGVPDEATRLACASYLAELAPRMRVAFASLRGKLPKKPAN